MIKNPSNSNIVSSLFNAQNTLSSLMAQSNKLAKLTGDACLIGQSLEQVLFVCNSEIMVSAFSPIVKGINPNASIEHINLSYYIDQKGIQASHYDAVVLILSDTADIGKITPLQNSHTKAAKIFVIAPQSFKLPSLSELGVSVTLTLESDAEDIRDTFLRGIQGEKFSQGFVDDIEEQYAHLTPRQKDVLKLIRIGKSNKEIARDLDISMGTIKVHCGAIFKELGVTNRIQAALVLGA